MCSVANYFFQISKLLFFLNDVAYLYKWYSFPIPIKLLYTVFVHC